MALTLPRTDLFTGIRLVAIPPQLVERQELSRSAGGFTRAKSLGEALWRFQYRTTAMLHDEALALEAKLNSLDGAVNRFYGNDIRRRYPKAHTDGDFTDAGVIASINANNKALALENLDPGFQLSVGDYLAFDYGSSPSRAFHQVMEAVTASGSPTGTTVEFEVRPHLRPGASASPAPSVTLKNPMALLALEPGSVSLQPDGPFRTIVSFSAIQVIE